MAENPKLPVWRTIADSFVFLFANWRHALRVGWVAVLVTIAVDLLFGRLAVSREWSLPWGVFIGFLEMLAYVSAIAAAVVPWHRLVLLNERPAGARLGRRARSYILCVVLLYMFVEAANWLIYLSALMTFEPPAGQDVLAGLLAILTGYLYFAGHLAVYAGFLLLMPILPAVAADRYRGVKQAFDLSRGNRLRLIAISLAVLLPSYMAPWAIDRLAGGAFDGHGAYLGSAVYAVNFVLQALIAATALSLCYHRMGGMGEAAPPASTES